MAPSSMAGLVPRFKAPPSPYMQRTDGVYEVPEPPSGSKVAGSPLRAHGRRPADRDQDKLRDDVASSSGKGLRALSQNGSSHSVSGTGSASRESVGRSSILRSASTPISSVLTESGVTGHAAGTVTLSLREKVIALQKQNRLLEERLRLLEPGPNDRLKPSSAASSSSSTASSSFPLPPVPSASSSPSSAPSSTATLQLQKRVAELEAALLESKSKNSQLVTQAAALASELQQRHRSSASGNNPPELSGPSTPSEDDAPATYAGMSSSWSSFTQSTTGPDPAAASSSSSPSSASSSSTAHQSPASTASATGRSDAPPSNTPMKPAGKAGSAPGTGKQPGGSAATSSTPPDPPPAASTSGKPAAAATSKQAATGQGGGLPQPQPQPQPSAPRQGSPNNSRPSPNATARRTSAVAAGVSVGVQVALPPAAAAGGPAGPSSCPTCTAAGAGATPELPKVVLQLRCQLLQANSTIEFLRKEHAEVEALQKDTEAQRREFAARYAFCVLDDDNDGYILSSQVQVFDLFQPYSPTTIDLALKQWKYASGFKGYFTMEDFLRFVTLADDRSTKESQRFWFNVIDMDGDGYISCEDAKYFYDAVPKGDGFVVSFEDLWYQLLDMVKPKMARRGFTAAELWRCKLGSGALGLLMNHNNMLLQRSTSEWGRGDYPL